MKSAFLAALIAWAAPATAGTVAIVDGDTIRIESESIRICEIDTPETWHSRCENELILGLRAKERLRALINMGEVTVERTGLDRYRRTLATVWVNTDDGPLNVGERLLSEGYALRYRPGGDAKLARLRTWCGPTAQFSDRWNG
jgi:endonuclease YncB( thermonuclease family)